MMQSPPTQTNLPVRLGGLRIVKSDCVLTEIGSGAGTKLIDLLRESFFGMSF